MKMKKVRTVAALGMILSLAWTGSFAIWSDQATSDASFTSGRVDISASPATAAFTGSNMAPGDVVYGGITVANSAAVDALKVKYKMTTSVTGATLGAALAAEVRAISGVCDATSWGASIDVMAGPSSLSALSIATWRPLDPGSSEVACFRISLPLSDTASQGLAATATFRFDSEQFANN